MNSMQSERERIQAARRHRRGRLMAAVAAAVAVMLFSSDALAVAYFSAASGAWNSNNRWRTVSCAGALAGAAYPGSTNTNDSATICNNQAVTLNISPAFALSSLTIGSTCANNTSLASSTTNVALTTGSVNVACSNSTLSFNGASGTFTLTVNGNITNSGNISISNSAAVHTLNVSGDITTTGATFDLRNNATRVCTLNLTGAGTQTLSGTTATVDFKNINAANSGNNFTINMSGSTVRLYGDVNSSGSLTVTAGTFNLMGTDGALSLAFGGSITNAGTIGIGSSSTRTHTMSVGGNIANNGTGTLDLRLDANDRVDLTFTGASGTTHTISGTSSGTTEFWGITTDPGNNLTINKTAGATITQTRDLTVNGNLTISSGTVTLSGSDGVAQALSVTGNITNSGTLTMSNVTLTHTLSIGGDFTNNGTFTFILDADTLIDTTFNGTVAQAIGGSSTTTFNNLTISNNNSPATAVSVNTSINVGNATSASTTLNMNGANTVLTPAAGVIINTSSTQGTITGSGTINVTRVAATADYLNQYKFTTNTLSGLTVNYSGAGAQTVNSTAAVGSYGNLIASNSGTKTLGGAVTVNGDLTVSTTNVTLDLSTFTADRASSGGTITVVSGSTLKIGGTNTFPANYSTRTLGATSTVDYNGTNQNVSNLGGQNYGNLTVEGSGTKTLTGGNANIVGDLSVNASGVTLDLGSNTANRTASGGTITVVSGAFLKIGGTNTFPSNYSSIALGATSTVDYTGTTQTVSNLGGANYGNLTASGSGTKTLGGNTNVAGNLTVSASGITLDLSTFTADRTASGGTISVASGATLRIGGTNGFPANYSTVTLTGSTVEYYGGDQNVRGLTYGNLTLSGASASTKTLVTANATVNGNLSVNATGTTFDLATFTANGTGTLLVAGGCTLKIGGTNGFPTGYGTVTLQPTSTVEYAGTAQTVANQSYANLTLSGNGAKTLNASMTTIAGNLTMTAGATANAVVGLIVNGNFTLSTTTANAFNAGGFTHQVQGNFSDTSSPAGFNAATSTVNFNGSVAQSISGGTNTAFNNVQIQNAAGVSLSGVVTKTVGGTLTLTSGAFSVGGNTLVLNGTIAGTATNLSTTSSSNLTLGGTASLTLPNNLAALNNLSVTKTSGTATLAANVAISGDLSVTGSGGTLDLATFTASRASAGGTLTVGAGAKLRIGGTNGFPANYGTVSLNASSTVEYYGSNQSIGNYTYGNLLLNPSGTGTSAGNTTVTGNLTINSGVYDMSTFTANGGGTGTLTVANGATLRIGGTNGFPGGYATVTLGATSTVDYAGSTQTVGGQSYGHLTLSGSGTKSLGANATVQGNLSVNTSGVTFDLGSNTCNAAVGTATITIGNGATLKIGGTNSFPSGYGTTTLGGTSTVEYKGSAQSVASLGYGNLTVSGSGTKTLAGNTSVAATLTINNGYVSTGASQLTVASAGSVSRCASTTECFVVGNLVRGVATGSPTLTWDIGVTAPSAAYTPVTLALAGVTVAGTILVTTTNGDHPSIGSSLIDSSKSANRYWSVTNTGVTYTSADVTLGFVAGDVDSGATPSNFAVGKFSSSDWSYPDVGTAGATSTQALTVLSGDGFGDFEVGEVKDANPLSLWHMNQSSWNGTANEVADSGSGGYHGTASTCAHLACAGSGAAPPVPTTSNVSPAIAGNPGTCYYGVFNRANKDYVALPAGFPNLGVDSGSTSFTITAWIRTTDNTQSGQRVFLDDQNNTQGFGFSLGDPGTGRLRFFSRGTSTISLDDSNVLANNRWYFVVAINDNTLKRKRIYVYDSVAASWLTSSTNTYTGTFGTGDAGPASIGGETDASGEGTSGFGFAGNIDEVRVYQVALGKAHLDRIRQETQPCISLNHFAISHDGTAVNCQAENITITAHQADHSVLSGYAGTVTLSTSTAHGDWTVVTANGTLSNGAANDGAATYTFVAGDAGQVVLGLKDTYPETVNIGVADGGITETSGTATSGEDQNLVYSQTGFNFLADSVASAVGTQISGKTSNVAPGNQTLEVQAIKTSDQTGACEAALNSSTTIQMKLANVNPAGYTSPIDISGTSVSNSYTNVTLNFSAGKAPFTLNYPDAGQIRLDAQYDIPLSGGGASGNLMQGSSNTFVVKPAGLCVESTDANSDCASGDATCSVFKAAGATFNLTVKGVAWQTSGESDSQFCSGNSTTPSFQLNSIALNSNLVAPSGGTNATLGVTSVNITSGGTQTAANETVSEVGVFTITATPPPYFGQTIAASTSANIGRFIPDRFAVTANTPGFDHACGAGAGAYTYMDQPFHYDTAPQLTLTALNASGSPVTTKNYGSSFWRLKVPPLSGSLLANRSFSDQSGHALQFEVVNGSDDAALAGDSDLDGQGTLTLTAGDVSGADKFTYHRTGTPEAPFSANVNMTIPAGDLTDADGVCYDSDNNGSCDSFTLSGITASGTGTEQLRFGRLVIGTAGGSELLPIDVPMHTEYFKNGAFEQNADDSCTRVGAQDPGDASEPFVTLSSAVEAGQSDGDVDVSNLAGCTGAGVSAASVGHDPVAAGDAGLELSAPGAGCTGYVNIRSNLGAPGPEWLRYDWDGGGLPDDDPAGRAVFGIYRGQDRLIYRREPWNP